MLKKKSLLRLMNFWPPFLGAGISVDFIASDFRQIHVSMKLKFWNKNYVNTHYGGSLYSMTDPFYMLMLMEILGTKYIVWDKAASIQFKRPGQGKVFAKFNLDQTVIDDIISTLEVSPKIEPVFKVEILNENGDIVAVVEKKLFIKKK